MILVNISIRDQYTILAMTKEKLFLEIPKPDKEIPV
jgi:hypothetical protein